MYSSDTTKGLENRDSITQASDETSAYQNTIQKNYNSDMTYTIKNKLITITLDGVEHKLWHLIKNKSDKRLQHKHDYDTDDLIRKLQNLVTSLEAAKALVWLNAFCGATINNNFQEFQKIGVKLTPEFKRQMSSEQNSALRCYMSAFRDERDELNDLVNEESSESLGSMVDNMKSVKKHLRKTKRKTSELYDSKKEWKEKNTPKPLPVKQFTKTEIEKLNQKLKGNK